MAVSEVFAILAVILLLAFLVESLTEYLFGQLFTNVPALAPYKWTQMYLAAAVGVVGSFVYQFDLLYLLSRFLGISLALTPMGMILTGLGIGRGAGYMHDIFKKFFTKPEQDKTVIEYKKTVETTPAPEVIAAMAEDGRG